MKVKITIIMLIVLMASSAFAFDGQRKGFVLGGGLGMSPAFKWEADVLVFDPLSGFYIANIDESNAGVGLNLVIGYAWDENNMVVYEGNVAGSNSDFFNQTITQGFNGATWYHYFGNEMSKQFFSTVGLGLYQFDGENFDYNDPGFGLLLGGGYEFSRHWQVGLYISSGKTSSGGTDFTHSHVNILVSGIAF